MKRNMKTFLVLGTILMGALLLQTKFTVQEKANELRSLAAQIHRDREALHVLDAEWAYKTSPAKLQEQSLNYLALMPVLPNQILGDLRDVPIRKNIDDPVNGSIGVLLPVQDRKTPSTTKIPQSAKIPVVYSTRFKKIMPTATAYHQDSNTRTEQ